MIKNKMKKIIQKIKIFELINNGINVAFINVNDIQKTQGGVICSIAIYDDDFSNKSIYSGIAYPQKLFINL